MQPVQPRMPHPAVAQISGHGGPHVMPIAGHRQDPGENGFAPAGLLESHSSAAGLGLYDPSFQHQTPELVSGQAAEAGSYHPHHQPSAVAAAPPLGRPQTAASYTAPSAAAVYYGARLQQQVYIASPGHINGVTAASTGACVADCLQLTHPNSTRHLPASDQESGARGHSLHYQPPTALSPTSYANQALFSHSAAPPNHNGFAIDAGQHITAFERPEVIGLYDTYQFSFEPSFQLQSTMGGGDSYPLNQQVGDEGSLLLMSGQPHQPQLASNGDCQVNNVHENIPMGHVVSQCSPRALALPVPNAVAPTRGTFGQNGWVEQGPPPNLGDLHGLRYDLINSELASDKGLGSVLELDGTSRKTKKRSAFDEIRRRETADTRSRKACLRCRIQKGRVGVPARGRLEWCLDYTRILTCSKCEVDPRNEDGECLKCQNYSKDSKKTIHHIPCYRNKLTDTVLFRKGGLKLTTRWEGTAMKDVGDRVEPQEIRTIHFTLGVCDQPLVVEVVRFDARPGDVTARYWIVREGIHGDEVRKKKELEPYCLANIWTTGTYFEKYVIDNAIPSIMKQNMPSAKLGGVPLAAPDVIQRTYTMAVEHYLSLEVGLVLAASDIVNTAFEANQHHRARWRDRMARSPTKRRRSSAISSFFGSPSVSRAS